MNQEHEQLRIIAATTSHHQSLMKQHDNNLAMIYQTPYLQLCPTIDLALVHIYNPLMLRTIYEPTVPNA